MKWKILQREKNISLNKHNVLLLYWVLFIEKCKLKFLLRGTIKLNSLQQTMANFLKRSSSYKVGCKKNSYTYWRIFPIGLDNYNGKDNNDKYNNNNNKDNNKNNNNNKIKNNNNNKNYNKDILEDHQREIEQKILAQTFWPKAIFRRRILLGYSGPKGRKP